MGRASSVSVVVINYNNARLLDRSLAAACLAEGVAEIIVVDDASTDNSASVITSYPVSKLGNPRNLGPVAARNVGAAHAISPYILFLDGDIAIDPAYAVVLAAYLDAHPKCGIVTGTVVERSKGRIWYNFGYDPSFIRDLIAAFFDRLILSCWHWTGVRTFLAWVATPFSLQLVPEAERYVDWVIESAFMVRTEVFRRVGGFDEGYRMFFEGPDLCRAVRKAGFGVAYVPSVPALHLGGHSQSTTQRREMWMQSRKRYTRKWGPFAG